MSPKTLSSQQNALTGEGPNARGATPSSEAERGHWVKFTARYTAILKLRRRDRLEFKSISGAQAKRAMRTVREFLY